MASSNRKLGAAVVASLRGKQKKKQAGEDKAEDISYLEMPTFGVAKSASSSSIPNPSRRSLGASSELLTTSSLADKVDTQHLDQETVLALTQDIRLFSDALSKLHNTLSRREETGQALRVTAHERLGDVLMILKVILKKYPPVNSTDLLTSTGVLISTVKSANYNDVNCDYAVVYQAVDQLAISFSSSVSEFLMGGMETSFALMLNSSQSLESSLAADSLRYREVHQRELLSAAKMDAHLQQMESGVELALGRAKVWSKYAKDVMTYVEQRTKLEMDFARGLAKLSQATRPLIVENSFLPFQSIFCTALDQDKDYATTSQAASNIIMNQKFIEPLNQRRNEHEKARKMLRDDWTKEVKKMNDAITNLKNAKKLYFQRGMEYEKAKELESKLAQEALGSSSGMSQFKNVEKKKRLAEDAFMRWQDAETTYKTCVHEANSRQMELEKTKGVILSQVRELITLCERTMKTASVAYFQLLHTVSAPSPVQYQTLCENCRIYEPGLQYSEFVRQLPNDEVMQHETFTFEPYMSEELRVRKSSSSQLESPSSNKNKLPNEKTGSESESLSSGNKSGENSPAASPYPVKKLETTANNLTSSTSLPSGSREEEKHGGHPFKKLRTPSRCRVCDSYVYFNGLECDQCGIACHKKCLFTLTQKCGSSHRLLSRRMTTFGVSFDDHIQSHNVEVPVIVTKCIEEIDKRGLDIKGIYRVSGVKSKVEKLCQSFENGGDIDLSEHHPNVISNVLKLYLRQLPEPLMTVRLYPEFVDVAREQAAGRLTEENLVARLKSIVDKLPAANFKTLARIIHHLSRVSGCEAENQMNSSNLGIVFGPTLLRPIEGPVNLESLIDTAHQTRAVELLVSNAEALFGPDDVMLHRQPTAIEEENSDGDNDSLSSEYSSDNRLNSIDSNLADEIMTALSKPSFKGSGVLEENRTSTAPDNQAFIRMSHNASSDCISMDSGSDELTDDEKLPYTPPSRSEGGSISIYHTHVIKSSTMPINSQLEVDMSPIPIEKSASTEFRFKQCDQQDGNRVTPLGHPTARTSYPRNNNTPVFLTVPPSQVNLSVPPTLHSTSITINPTGSNRLEHTISLLPDIGAPDITEELYSSDRLNSSESIQQKGDGHSESSTFRNQKSVFYTHSMKKKSTEPKFV